MANEFDVNYKVLAKGNDVIGASGTSGHTIVNSTDEEFPQRKKLKFSSQFFDIVDNESDDTTEIRVGTIPINPPTTTGLNAYILDDSAQGFNGFTDFAG